MLKNYFKIALRNLIRYKGFSFINILGLAIGITGCLVIGIFVWDELKYDKNITGGEQVYRVYDQRSHNGDISYAACVAPAYATFLKNQYPEVDTTARVMMLSDRYLMESETNKGYEQKGWFTESSFFKVFPLKFVKGDRASALLDPNSIIITTDIAERYFGKEDPIGKILKINKGGLAVKGVVEKPDHFHFDFNYLMPLKLVQVPAERMESWHWHQFYTYAKLKEGTSAEQLQHKFQQHVKTEIHPTLEQEGSSYLPYFQRLQDIHLKSAEFTYDNAVRGNETYVKALTIIAIFVLAIACFNFINLATARSFRRAKEIGVRKVIGAERKQLIFQFISETVLLSLLAVVIATAATYFLIPVLNDFTGKSIEFNPFINPELSLLILAGGIVVGVLAGIYPALVLSGFQPIKVLKSIKLTGNGGSIPWLRQALVVLQFSLSGLLIVCAIIVYNQTNYLNSKDLGFNKEQVLHFQVRDSVANSLETFKSELKRSPNILSVTSGYGLPGDQYAGDGVNLPSMGGKELSANLFLGDHDYIKTLGLRIIAGRDFSKDMSTDATQAFIINETAVKEFGFGSPDKALGQPINWNEWQPLDSTQPVKKGQVIGVVQDFHYKSLHEKLLPAVIHIYPQATFKIAAKVNTADISSTIAFINETWKRFVPDYPLDYKFMDESYGEMYKSEEKLASLLWIFTLMAIIVGCMGLFGLAAFSAEQRTKEIGIRKILGASVLNIMGVLSRKFIWLIIISSCLAFPVAWWAMNDWLNDFPYRVNISWWVFAVALIAALAIALITVSLQSIKAATTNPVKSLRSE